MKFDSDLWAVILGGSSGFGLAAAQKLAAHGMNLCIIHRDRRGPMKQIEFCFEQLKKTGVKVVTFNVDALSEKGRGHVLDALAIHMGETGKIKMLLHSIAFGNLKLLAPFDSPDQTNAPVFDNTNFLGEDDFSHTIHAMGTSIVKWVQDIFTRKMFTANARVLGLTSEGNKVAWRGYAAVSAAKAALEAVFRSIAVEYAPYGIRANVIQPGVSDTAALRAIPGNDQIRTRAIKRNPMGRLTTPADVGDLIFLLCLDEASWINGAHIHVDGGERIA